MTKQNVLNLVNDSISSIFTKEDVIRLVEQIESEKTQNVNVFGLTEDQMDDLVLAIAENIDSEGVDLFSDYELDMNYREVELSSVEYRLNDLKQVVADAIENYISENKFKDNE